MKIKLTIDPHNQWFVRLCVTVGACEQHNQPLNANAHTTRGGHSVFYGSEKIFVGHVSLIIARVA